MRPNVSAASRAVGLRVARVLDVLIQYRRIWRATRDHESSSTPCFYLGALGIGLGTLVNRSSGSPSVSPYVDFVAPGMLGGDGDADRRRRRRPGR